MLCIINGFKLLMQSRSQRRELNLITFSLIVKLILLQMCGDELTFTFTLRVWNIC